MLKLEALMGVPVAVKTGEQAASVIFHTCIEEWSPRQLKCVIVAAIQFEYTLQFELSSEGGVYLTVSGQLSNVHNFFQQVSINIGIPHIPAT